ncbi:MAG: acyl-ACP--UDP-N-acetylglucosamine O-acyltransferase [Firmicutes bacterium]|nr:acyl-ACP--UDP-N-acetylglucosamine O-acyltransferase [Bacillota bacterium]
MRLPETASKELPRGGIHPTAIVHPGAELGCDVSVGPYTIIGDGVVIGDGTTIGASVMIEGQTFMGKGNVIYAGSILGNEPQDVKYKGEKTWLFIGDNNVIREYVTVSRGTAVGHGETRIGDGNRLMSFSHVAHDCQVGNNVTVMHGAGIAGHVSLGDGVTVGGFSGVHQFTKIGRMASVGAHSMVGKDVPPYVVVNGNPARVHGVNVAALCSYGLSREVRDEIKKAYKILYKSSLNVSQAIEQMEHELQASEEIDHFLRFLRNADRGICR